MAFQTVDGNDHGGVKISHGDGGKIELFASNQSRTQIYANVITANVNGLEIKTTDGQHLVFGSNNTTRMTVRSEGHIQVREWTDAFGQINIQAGHVLADDAQIDITPKGNTHNRPLLTFRGLPINEKEEFLYELEDEIEKTTRSFSLNNKKQETNLIDALTSTCRKFTKQKTGKRPLANINLVRI